MGIVFSLQPRGPLSDESYDRLVARYNRLIDETRVLIEKQLELERKLLAPDAPDGSPRSRSASRGWRLNRLRRHLDESQRALVAARIATMRQGARTDLASTEATSQNDAADLLNVGRASVQRAREVLDHGAPELVRAVEQGRASVSAAPGREPARAGLCAHSEPSARWR